MLVTVLITIRKSRSKSSSLKMNLIQIQTPHTECCRVDMYLTLQSALLGGGGCTEHDGAPDWLSPNRYYFASEVVHSLSISDMVDKFLPVLHAESSFLIKKLFYVDYIDYNKRSKENNMRQLHDVSGSTTKRMTHAL